MRTGGVFFGRPQGYALGRYSHRRPGDAPLAVMGLHLIDLNLVAGNLVEVIQAQVGEWR